MSSSIGKLVMNAGNIPKDVVIWIIQPMLMISEEEVREHFKTLMSHLKVFSRTKVLVNLINTAMHPRIPLLRAERRFGKSAGAKIVDLPFAVPWWQQLHRLWRWAFKTPRELKDRKFYVNLARKSTTIVYWWY